MPALAPILCMIVVLAVALHVGPVVGAVASVALRTAGEAVAERAPGQQVAGR